MDVAVNDHGPFNEAGVLQGSHGDCHIIEDAKTGTVGSAGMVTSARGAAGNPALQGEASGQDGAADGITGAAGEGLAHGQADFPFDSLRHRLIDDVVHVAFIMRQADRRRISGIRDEKTVRACQSRTLKQFRQVFELAHREPMPFGQINVEERVMDNGKRHGFGI